MFPLHYVDRRRSELFCWRFALLFTLIGLNLTGSSAYAQRIIYVDRGATGASDGSSWSNAFISLQDALIGAQDGDEIWVAKGTYRPDQGRRVEEGDREASFHLKSGIAVYGGFRGTEERLEMRNWLIYPTILSGDLLDNDRDAVTVDEPTRRDNSFNVVVIDDGTDTMVFDGFTIMSGQATGILSPRHTGGGMVIGRGAQVRLSNLRFQNNLALDCGGALVNHGRELMLEASHFSNNHSVIVDEFCGGGALYHTPIREHEVDNRWAHIKRVRFENNSGCNGGAMLARNATLVVTESIFINNTAKCQGGAVYHKHVRKDQHAIYANVAFLGNQSEAQGRGGAALFNEESNVLLYNSVFSGNDSYSDDPFFNGGAIVNIDRSQVIMINNTVTGNTTLKGGGAMHNNNSDLTIWNSILWNNQSGTLSGEIAGATYSFMGPFSHRVGYSIAEEGMPEAFTDEGQNLMLDPMFVDADGPDNMVGTEDDNVRLLNTSPAIDAGDNEILLTDTLGFGNHLNMQQLRSLDFDGNARNKDGGSGRFTIDIGAYEFSRTRPTVEEPEKNLLLLEAFPNPFQETALLRFSTGESLPVRVQLYDVRGRLVETLFSGMLPVNGVQQILIKAEGKPSGLYYARMMGKGIDEVQPILLVR